MSEMTVLSMGWGVQTWTMAAMMALDELPRADLLVFADTTHEHGETYRFIEAWQPWLGEHGLTIHTVTGPRNDVVMQGSVPSVTIPAFTVDVPTGKQGQIRRQCTHAWKINPIRQFIRREMAKRGLPTTAGIVETWLGISFDEWVRMRDSDVKYITNVYPLIDRRMTRAACHTWLDTHNLPTPPKSACVFCPYKSQAAWRELKRAGGPDWAHSLDVDEAIRSKRPKAELFIHPARRPLSVAINIPEDHGASQMTLDDLCDGGHCNV